ncbi:phage head-tail joining protein [Oceanospirillum beijerinckii]|uniref:phage head-tail joining protein n=1 Tax=Oceanospirillum beijerinckii TaxID=64976 RepID=UPI000416162F|nr:gpW family head-tail joining protein [Oceanospirillum beijerinckii]
MATQAQLDEAKAALHKVTTGKGVASIQKDGRKVEYTPVNVSELRSYIRELESVLASSQRRRAFRVF